MIIKNTYLGLLLLTLASTSAVFSGKGAPARGERRAGWWCCMGAAKGLANVADELREGPTTIEDLMASFLEGFTEGMFMASLVRSETSGAGAGESKDTPVAANPFLFEKLMGDITRIMTYHKIRTADIHAYLKKNGDPAVGSEEETRLLTALQLEVVPKVETSLTCYAATLTAHRTPDEIAAISATFRCMAETRASEDAQWVEAEPFIQLIARQMITNLTTAPGDAHAAWAETSNRKLLSVARSTASLATVARLASARSVTTGAAKDDTAATETVEVTIDDNRPTAPVAPRTGWCCWKRKS